MKKAVKCMFLTLIICLALFASPVFASTNGVTRDQAVAWANSQVGQALDYDGVYGAQCVDLVKYYYKYLGQSPVQGNGADYSHNALPGGWNRLPAGTQPEPGDIAYYTGGYGHVFIISEADSVGNNGIHQNYNYVQRCQKVWTRNSAISGLIRPDFRPSDTTPPVISNATTSNVNSNGYDVSCTVTDNVGVGFVEFPTWTLNQGQDDLANIWPRGSQNGNTWTFHVSISDHNNESGNYLTHIYATDTSGNRSVFYCPVVNVPPPQGSPVGGGERILSDGDYHIASAIDETKGLDAEGAVNENGTNIQLWSSMNESNQVFTVKWLGDGYYSITHKQTGKLLDVTQASLNYGANVWLYEDNGSDAQKWVIRESNDPHYLEIVSKCNGLNLDVTNLVNANGTNIQMCPSNSSSAQKWRFIAWGRDTGQTVPDGKYEVVPALDDNKCLDVNANGTENGSNVQIWSRLNGDNQKWNVKYLGDGYYTLTDSNSGKVLDLTGNYQTLRANVNIWEPLNIDGQKWILKDAGDGYYYIICKGSGLCVDVANGENNDGTNVWGWIVHGSTAQRWKFVKDEPVKDEPETDQYTVSVTASPTEGGSVSGGGSFKTGEPVTVKATPNSGYSFDGWYNGDTKVSGDTSYQFYVSANTNLVARFVEGTDPDPDPDPTPTAQVEIYRLYNGTTGEHLYTISQAEVKALTPAGWNYEGVGWVAPNTGQAVYRLYNSAINDHLYTMDENEAKTLTTRGWTMDFGGEPIFYSGGNTPVYRLYNETTKRHHLTTDAFEYEVLAGNGWKQEGQALHALSK